MEQLDKEHTLIRRYLLGELGEEARERLEERVMLDREFKGLVLLVEDELIEDYLDGTLEGRDREKFDEHLLSSPRNLWDAKVLQALTEYAANRPSDSRPAEGAVPAERTGRMGSALRWLAGLLYFRLVAGVGFATVALLILVGVWRLFGGEDRAEVERVLARLNGSPGSSDESRPVEAFQPSSVLQVTVEPPTSTRGVAGPRQVDSQELTVPSKVSLIRFRLQLLKAESPSYEVLFQDGEGRDLFAVSGLKVDNSDLAPAVNLLVPPKYLPAGDNRILLKAANPEGRFEVLYDYPLRVLKR